jgi:hypothetical protein
LQYQSFLATLRTVSYFPRLENTTLDRRATALKLHAPHRNLGECPLNIFTAFGPMVFDGPSAISNGKQLAARESHQEQMGKQR